VYTWRLNKRLRIIAGKEIFKMKPKILTTILLSTLVALSVIASAAPISAKPFIIPGTIDPKTIPQFVNQLTGPPPYYVPNATGYYEVFMNNFTQQILPAPLPKTSVWGYGGETNVGFVQNAPGPSFEATQGTPITVKYTNNITGSHLFAVDPTLHWADPNDIGMDPPTPWPTYPPGFPDAQSPVPLIPHLHGGEVQSTSDGHPEAWFTATGVHGDAYNTVEPTTADSAVFYYPNAQPPATLWYHDHGLGITRINVMSGLAGFYLLRNSTDPFAASLPSVTYEMPLVIQDRTFQTNGDFWFDTVGLDPAVHPYWMPEFFGNTIMVNGLVWPNMDVDLATYRFRLLDGSNARFYDLWFQVKPGPLNPNQNPPRLGFWQIASDGGYLPMSVPLTRLTIAPGERADIVVDFTGLFPGDRVILRNRAKTPFPNGASPDPKTTGTIMQFTVLNQAGPQKIPPTVLNTNIPVLTPDAPSRTLVLWEVMGALGPTEILLNGQKWMADVSEQPVVGTTEDWIIVNPTADTHPIHLHLAQFQLVSRQKINTAKYAAAWILLQQTTGGLGAGAMPAWPNDYTVLELPIAPYLKGKPTLAPANEKGWKDTIQMNPGEVTIIRVRFAPIDGTATYPFDPTVDPGYVWHCHILDHEDNEMMRPYTVVN
jgi:spore coat protein A